MILGNTEDCVKLNPIKTNLSLLDLKQKISMAITINLLNAFDDISNDKNNLNCLILDTVKGKGVKRFENQAQWHYWQV